MCLQYLFKERFLRRNPRKGFIDCLACRRYLILCIIHEVERIGLNPDYRSSFIVFCQYIPPIFTIITMEFFCMFLNLIVDERSTRLEPTENCFRFSSYMDEEIRLRKILERLIEYVNKILSCCSFDLHMGIYEHLKDREIHNNH